MIRKNKKMLVGIALGMTIVIILALLPVMNNIFNKDSQQPENINVDAVEVELGPDLEVSYLTATKYEGSKTTVNYKIKNIGNAILLNKIVTTKITIYNYAKSNDKQWNNNDQQLTLAANGGESSMFSVDFFTTMYNCVHAWVDAPDNINEENENNNKKNINIKYTAINPGQSINVDIAIYNPLSTGCNHYSSFDSIEDWLITLSETTTYLDGGEVYYIDVQIKAPETIQSYPTIIIQTEDVNGEYQYNEIVLQSS